MARRAGPVWVFLVVVLPGCFPMSETAMVPTSPFGSAAAVTAGTMPNAPPATNEAAINVARVGLKVLNANPDLRIRPQFSVIGAQNSPPELFHSNESIVFITESLARQCRTEGELAALLSTELARIVVERAAIGVTDVSDRGPPPAVIVGNEYGGSFGPADGTRMMELAKYERKRTLARERAAPPAPEALAGVYLKQAGYDPAEMAAVASLLKSADGRGKLEKQLSASGPK